MTELLTPAERAQTILDALARARGEAGGMTPLEVLTAYIAETDAQRADAEAIDAAWRIIDQHYDLGVPNAARDKTNAEAATAIAAAIRARGGNDAK